MNTILVLLHQPKEYSHPLSLLRCLCLHLPWLEHASSPDHHSVSPLNKDTALACSELEYLQGKLLGKLALMHYHLRDTISKTSTSQE